MERAIIQPARIQSGKVEIKQGEEWYLAEDVTTLSQGNSDSQGFAVIGDSVAVYIVNTQPDLQTTINQLVAVCDQLISIGDSQYIIGATGAAFGTPLKSVSESSKQIKKQLEDLKLR